MNQETAEALFEVWSRSRPDLIHTAWDLTNCSQMLQFLVKENLISAGPKQLSSVESFKFLGTIHK